MVLKFFTVMAILSTLFQVSEGAPQGNSGDGDTLVGNIQQSQLGPNDAISNSDSLTADGRAAHGSGRRKNMYFTG